MHETTAVVCSVLLIAGLALQFRQYRRSTPEAKPGRRIALIVQAILSVLLIALNFNLIF